MTPAGDLFELKGYVALVTGATGHLGRQIAGALAMAGAHVIVHSRSRERATALTEQIAAVGCSAEPCVFDVTDHESIDSALGSLGARKLNVVVNNAYSGGAGTIEHATAEDYRGSYEIVVVAAHAIVRAALPGLRLAVAQDGDASVINVASMYGMVSPDHRLYESLEAVNPPFYGSAKAALIQWTRYAACEFGKEGLRINCVSPGPFPSSLVRHQHPDFVSQLASRVPLGRTGDPSELRGPILFLASRASSFVTGANLVVDGGWTCW